MAAVRAEQLQPVFLTTTILFVGVGATAYYAIYVLGDARYALALGGYVSTLGPAAAQPETAIIAIKASWA